MTVDVSLLPRSQSLALPSGLALETPLLIPSFSSRGFPFRGTGRTLRSTIREPLEVAQDWITDVLLVSAYDLSNGHLPNREALEESPPGTPYAAPALIMIDSGCYEASETLDLPDARRAAIEVMPWDHGRLMEVIQSCDEGLSAAIVNYDHYGPMDEQIARARDYFILRPRYLHDLLLKPIDRGKYLDVDEVVGHASRLRGFHIVGFTEKELANSLLDRMIAIARIRGAMDEAGISAPIHVFGSLDPVLSPLYFLAGAEVFDGLSWLYMSYREGLATYSEAAAALNSQWTAKVHQKRSVQLYDNLTELTDLALSMRRFLTRQDLSEFRHHATVFREGRENLRAKLERQR